MPSRRLHLNFDLVAQDRCQGVSLPISLLLRCRRWELHPARAYNTEEGRRSAYRRNMALILGLSCRFPESASASSFWNNLINGENMVSCLHNIFQKVLTHIPGADALSVLLCSSQPMTHGGQWGLLVCLPAPARCRASRNLTHPFSQCTASRHRCAPTAHACD